MNRDRHAGIVAGKISSKDLMQWIKKGNGTYSAKTVEGGMLTFTVDMHKIKITYEKGGTAWITTPDVSNPTVLSTSSTAY